MNQKIISMLLIMLMVMTVSIQQAHAAQKFVDVSSTAEAFNEINYLVDQQVINGYTQNGKKYFKPLNHVTRWQAAKMVVNASGNKPLKAAKSSFSDVKLNSEASLYIERAVQLGFIETDGSGKFYPHKPLTRAEMSYALTKAFQLNSEMYSKFPTSFDDITNNHPYKATINAVYYSGIAQGSNGKFMPNAPLTRNQFALFVARATNEKFRLPIPSLVDTSKVIGIIEVTTDGLNVRTTPNATNDANILGKVNKGGKLSVYEITDHWLKVSYKGTYVYISKSYAKFLDGYGNEIVTVEKKKVTTVKPLQVFVKASLSTNVIHTIEPGETISVYGETDGYYLVMVGDLPGYIPKEEVEEEKSFVQGRVTASTLTVRAAGSAQATALNSLKKGTLVEVESITGYWAKIKYSGGQGYVHKSYLKLINTTGSAVKDRIIILDPGHGGKDPGATKGTVLEKTIVLKVTQLVKQKLEAAGAKVHMTRTGDTYPTLPERVKFTNDNFGELFVSIHVNSAITTAASGTEVYYHVTTGDSYEEEKVLAELINNEIVKQANMKNRGVKQASYYVINQTVIPSVLVELGFISNAADLAKLTSSKYIEIYANAVYDGIVKYYEKK